MKTIGLIGGMSWESTALYYQWLNEGVKAQLGGLHSAKIVLVSVDFAEIEALQHAGDWDAAGDILATAARSLDAAGAELILICTNTMHKVAPAVESATSVPLLHLADSTAERLIAAGVKRVGLLGTAFTMEQDFYVGRLRERHQLDVVVPTAEQRAAVHRIIYDELCLGEIRDASRTSYLDIIASMHANGCEAVILGCTEITLLVKQHHTPVPLFDTTAIHAEVALERAINS